MPRSRSRSPRRDRDRHSRRRRSRSRSPRGSSRRYRSRSPRRRRSRSSSPRRRRSPPNYRPTVPVPPPSSSKSTLNEPISAQMTLGGSLGVTGKRKKKKQNQQLSMAVLEDMTDEDKSMQQIMGFGGFDTSKGKKIKGNDVSAVNKKVERKYRQYMNRKGGFNRPLEKIA